MRYLNETDLTLRKEKEKDNKEMRRPENKGKKLREDSKKGWNNKESKL